MGHRDPEGLGRLPRQRAPAGIRDGHRHHHRDLPTAFLAAPIDGEQGRLGVQGIKGCLHQENIRASIQQAAHLVAVDGNQLIECDGAEARVIDIRRQGGSSVRGADRAGDESRAQGIGSLRPRGPQLWPAARQPG